MSILLYIFDRKMDNIIVSQTSEEGFGGLLFSDAQSLIRELRNVGIDTNMDDMLTEGTLFPADDPFTMSITVMSLLTDLTLAPTGSLFAEVVKVSDLDQINLSNTAEVTLPLVISPNVQSFSVRISNAV